MTAPDDSGAGGGIIGGPDRGDSSGGGNDSGKRRMQESTAARPLKRLRSVDSDEPTASPRRWTYDDIYPPAEFYEDEERCPGDASTAERLAYVARRLGRIGARVPISVDPLPDTLSVNPLWPRVSHVEGSYKKLSNARTIQLKKLVNALSPGPVKRRCTVGEIEQRASLVRAAELAMRAFVGVFPPDCPQRWSSSVRASTEEPMEEGSK